MQKKNYKKTSVLKFYAPIISGGRINIDESDFEIFSKKGVPNNLVDEWREENDFWGLDLSDPGRCALLVDDIEITDLPKMIEIFLAQEESENKLQTENSEIYTEIQKGTNKPKIRSGYFVHSEWVSKSEHSLSIDEPFDIERLQLTVEGDGTYGVFYKNKNGELLEFDFLWSGSGGANDYNFYDTDGKKLDFNILEQEEEEEDEGEVGEEELLEEKIEEQLKVSVEVTEDFFGDESFEVAVKLDDLAQHLCGKGDFKNAELFLKRALNIGEMKAGPNSDIAATYRFNIGILYRDWGKYKNAEKELKKSLRIYEGIYGKDSIEISATLSALGSLYMLTNRNEDAKDSFKRCLTIRESKLEPDDQRISLVRNRLADAISKEIGGLDVDIDGSANGVEDENKTVDNVKEKLESIAMMSADAYEKLEDDAVLEKWVFEKLELSHNFIEEVSKEINGLKKRKK